MKSKNNLTSFSIRSRIAADKDTSGLYGRVLLNQMTFMAFTSHKWSTMNAIALSASRKLEGVLTDTSILEEMGKRVPLPMEGGMAGGIGERGREGIVYGATGVSRCAHLRQPRGGRAKQ